MRDIWRIDSRYGSLNVFSIIILKKNDLVNSQTHKTYNLWAFDSYPSRLIAVFTDAVFSTTWPNSVTHVWGVNVISIFTKVRSANVLPVYFS